MDADKSEIIEKLKDKNAVAACDFAKQLGAESAASDKYLEMIEDFAGLLKDKSSYVRTRAFSLICDQARWANEGQIEKVFDRMCILLNDEKPTVVRVCLGALHGVALFRPELAEKIRMAVSKIELSKYKDSMSPLIEKDIKELLKIIA